jgi:hypothetical protein
LIVLPHELLSSPSIARPSWQIAGLVITLKAAPIMLGVRDISDAAALQLAFDGFHFWGNIRGVCQVLVFVAQLWTVAVLLRRSGQLQA